MQSLLNHRLFAATIIGNIVEHFDKVVFALIAPFIAPYFFPNKDPIVSLILIYLPVGMLFRPLGAIFWGYIGDRYGRKKTLFLSLLGMSTTFFLVGCIPYYDKIGWTSALLMHLCRGIICFFAAGEGPSAALILIENSPKDKKDLMSSYYEMSSMLGVLMGSVLLTVLAFYGRVLELWRVLFMVCGCVGVVGLILRRDALKDVSYPSQKISLNPLPVIRQYAPAFFTIMAVTGFSYSNYRILTKLMNGYLPLVTQLTNSEMMGVHTVLIIFDFFILLPFGYLSKKIGKTKQVAFSLICALLGIFPIFQLLHHPTINNVLILRLVLVIWGVALAAPFNYWASSLIPENVRLRVLSLARAFGAQLIGAPSLSLSLLLYKKTGWITAPAYVLFGIAGLALGAMGVMKLVERRRLTVDSMDSFSEPS